MEVTESISPEIKATKWTYDKEFREYLLLLSRKGEKGLERTKNFPKEPIIDELAEIAGETTVKEPVVKVPQEIKETDTEEISQIFAGIRILTTLIGVISTFIVGLILIKLFPNYMESCKDQIEKKTWKSLGFGLLVLFVTPVLFIPLLIFVVTIPLALMTIAIYSIYLYLAKMFVIYWVGGRFFKNSTRIASFGLSVLIYALLTLIPIIGGFVSFITLLFGLGAGMLVCYEIYNKMKVNKIA